MSIQKEYCKTPESSSITSICKHMVLLIHSGVVIGDKPSTPFTNLRASLYPSEKTKPQPISDSLTSIVVIPQNKFRQYFFYLYAERRCGGRIAIDNITLFVHQEFGEVPLYAIPEKPSFHRLHVLVYRSSIRPIHIHLHASNTPFLNHQSILSLLLQVNTHCLLCLT